MASLWNWLGNQAHGIEAQLNPWDGGQTYNSVVHKKKKPQPVQPAQPQINYGAINQGLNQGKSWENIAAQTNTPFNAVRAYSQQTRPNYGIPQPQPTVTVAQPKLFQNNLQVVDNKPVFDQSLTDPNKIYQAYQTDFGQYSPQDKVRVLQAGAKNGVFDKNQASQAVNQILSNSIDAPVKPNLNPLESFVGGAVSTGQKTLNTLGAAASGVEGAGKVAFDNLTGNQQAAQADNALYNQKVNDYLTRKTITGDQGAFVSPQTVFNGNMGQFTKDIGNTTAEIAPWVLPYRKIAETAGLLAKPTEAAASRFVGTTLAKGAGKAAQYGAEAGITAPIYGGLNAIQQGATTGQFDPRQAINAGLQGGAMVGAGHGIVDTATGGLKAAKAGASAVHGYIQRLPRLVREDALKRATDSGQVQMAPVNDLVSYEGAPDKAKVNRYKTQIQNGQPVNPIIVMQDSTGRFGIEDGKHRFQAYKELGINQVPVKVATPDGLRAALPQAQSGFVKIPGGKEDPLAALKKEADPIVNQKTGQTLSQSIKELQKNGWSKQDIEKYRQAVLGQNKPQPKVDPNAINDLNPTGGVFVDYNPQARMTAPLGSDITTLDKTAGMKPTDTVTIYRGAPKSQGKINPGDFVTTNKELAQSYTGDGNVLSAKVPASHILDSKSSPLGEEYIYRPNQAHAEAKGGVSSTGRSSTSSRQLGKDQNQAKTAPTKPLKTSSSDRSVEISTKSSPKDSSPQKSPARQGINQNPEPVKSQERSSVNNTPKQRGFTNSVKHSEEVSPVVRKGASGEYNQRSTAQMALKADHYAKGNLKNVTQETHDVLAKKTGTISDQEIANSIAVAKRLDAKGDHEQATQIYDKLAEHGTKGGQAIQAFSLLRNRTPDGVRYQAIKTFKKAGVELTKQDEHRLGQLIDEVRKTRPNTEARDMALHNVVDFVDKRIPTSVGHKLVNFWRAGLLTSPVTTAGNILGNASEAATRNFWVNPTAAATDKFFSLFTGKRTKTLAGGQTSGGLKGVKKGATYMKTGFDARRQPNLKLDAPRRVNYKNKYIDAYVNGVYRWMGAQDQPFYYAAEKQAIRDLATADAKNMGLKGQAAKDYITKAENNPEWKPQTFKSSSNQENAAKYAVYQNETLLGHMAGGLKRYADQHSGVGGAIANFLLPFSQVPASVAMRIVDRTPLGIAKEVVSQIKNKSFDQRAMSEAVANGTFALPVFAAGVALAKSGLITGAYPSDPKERELWKSEGKQEYSVKVGNRWYSLNYMQPFGTLLAIGGQFQKDMADGKSASEAWNKVGATALNSVESQSFLQGINGILSAVNDPNRSAAQYTKSTASSIVPNFIRTAARALDPSQRDTNNIGDAIKGAIPGVRQTLPQKLDMYGKPLKGYDNFWNQMFNPLRPDLIRNGKDPVTNELRRLQDGGNGIIPTQYNKSSITGKRLTDNQVRQLNAAVNPHVYDAWKKIIAKPGYKSLSDENKQAVLEDAKRAVSAAYKDIFARSSGIIDATSPSKNLSSDAKKIINGGMPDFISGVSSKSSHGISIDIKPNLPQAYKSTLQRYEGMSSDQRDKIFATQNDAEYKYNLAKFMNDQSSMTPAQKIRAQNTLAKERVGSVYPKNVRDLYSLSKSDLYSYLTTFEKGVDKNKIGKQLIAYDKSLANNGLISSTKFKNGIAPYGGKRLPAQPSVNVGNIRNARQSYVNSIRKSAAKYGVDEKAALAVAAAEGLGGGVGDNGTSFGPFQLHVGGALPQGKGRAWAESPAGIDYAMGRIAQVTRGKSGAAAIQAIVNSFERPLDPQGEIAKALSIYSGKPVSLGAGYGGSGSGGSRSRGSSRSSGGGSTSKYSKAAAAKLRFAVDTEAQKHVGALPMPSGAMPKFVVPAMKRVYTPNKIDYTPKVSLHKTKRH